jgi:hypothetical protein
METEAKKNAYARRAAETRTKVSHDAPMIARPDTIRQAIIAETEALAAADLTWSQRHEARERLAMLTALLQRATAK